jgi:hypothetical protein
VTAMSPDKKIVITCSSVNAAITKIAEKVKGTKDYARVVAVRIELHKSAETYAKSCQQKC